MVIPLFTARAQRDGGGDRQGGMHMGPRDHLLRSSGLAGAPNLSEPAPDWDLADLMAPLEGAEFQPGAAPPWVVKGRVDCSSGG